MIRAIIFDMFGTIVIGSEDRKPIEYRRTHELLKSRGLDVPYDDFIRLWFKVIDGLDHWSAQTQREYPMLRVASEFLAVFDADPTPELASEVSLSYIQERFGGLRAFPGVPRLLADVARHFRLGLVTNIHDAPVVYEQLERNRIRQHFDVIVTSAEHGWRKPHPSIFTSALRGLQISAEEAIFVGDSYESDYLGALSCGLAAILIDPARSHPIPPLHRIGSILELPEHPSLRGRSDSAQ